MVDPILKELWRVKDDIAREHGYDIDALAAHLQTKRGTIGQPVVDLSALKRAAEDPAGKAK